MSHSAASMFVLDEARQARCRENTKGVFFVLALNEEGNTTVTFVRTENVVIVLVCCNDIVYETSHQDRD